MVFRLFKFIPKDLLIDSNSSINTDTMNFLSIDCSTETGSLFLKAKNKTFKEVLQSDKFNNDLLVKQILDFLRKNDIKFENISQIFVNQGPGSFSGLRASLAIAKGLSLSKNLKLSGYDTFIWSCSKFFNKKDYMFSLLKFREKYFLKKFDKHLNGITTHIEISINQIVNNYNNEFIVIPKETTEKTDKKILKLNNLKITELDHNDLESLQEKGLLNENLIKPLYLS